MAHTVPTSLHREGHRRRTNCRTVVGTLYVVITAPRSRYIYTLSYHQVLGKDNKSVKTLQNIVKVEYSKTRVQLIKTICIKVLEFFL